MNRKEYNDINKIDNLISVEDLSNVKDRTLLYGYTFTRDIFHVYLKNGNIHAVIYDTIYGYLMSHPINMLELDIKSNYDYVPDKRLYPEACDYEFCKLLKERNIDLPFVHFNKEREIKDFYGFTLEDIR